MMILFMGMVKGVGNAISPFNFDHNIDSLHFNQKKKNLKNDFIYKEAILRILR